MTSRFDRWRHAHRVFRLPFSRTRARREIEDELAFHLEGRIDEFMQAGMSAETARAEAHRRFGNYQQYRKRTLSIHERTMLIRRRVEALTGLWREILHAGRVLLRTPSFSLVACLTLALGIGAATAIYTVVDAVVLRSLPYSDAGRLVSVLHPTVAPGSQPGTWGLSEAGYFHFAAENRTLENLGAYRTNTLTVIGGDIAEQVSRGVVTASLFPILRAAPAIGRLIDAQDDRPGVPNVAVLGHEFWRRRFDGDSGVVGRTLTTTSGSFEIIGVAEPGFTLPQPGQFSSRADLRGFRVDVWTPLRLDPSAIPQNHHYLSGVGRLRDGVTVSQAKADLQSLTERFPELFPTAYSQQFIDSYRFRVGIRPLRDEVLGPSLPRTIWILFAAVGLVLVIASTNVANLFLVRMETRRRESAIRTALGASRPRMLAHFLAESVLLTTVAAVLGLGLASVELRALLAIAPTDIPRLADVTLSGHAVVFSVVLAGVVGLVLGLIPLARTRLDVTALHEGGRAPAMGRTSTRARSGLVIGQVALALILLTAAGLMFKTVYQLRQVEPGLEADRVLLVRADYSYQQHPSLEEALGFHRSVIDRISALPGVTRVGATNRVPLRDFGIGCTVVFREGRPYQAGESTPCVATPSVSPGFFEALGIVVSGTYPTWRQIDDWTAPAVITRQLADRLWPGEDPIGKGINSNSVNSPRGFFRVVGVIPHLQAEGLDRPPTEAIFYPTGERAPGSRTDAAHTLTYVIRTSLGNPMSLVPQVQAIVSELDAGVPLTNPQTMEQVLHGSMARTFFVMTLLSLAGLMALVLSAVGIYGVIAYLVTQRQAEIGVRMALGAQVGQVARLVVRESLAPVLVGVGLGLGGSYLGTRVLAGVLYDVSPNDPAVLVTVSALLIGVAVVASLGPARRATKVDPVVVLKGD